MLHPRIGVVDGRETLIDDTQMVGYKEHMTQQHRILFFNGFIGARCVHCGGGETDAHNLLMALDSLSHKPIRLVITSHGGLLDPTFFFYDTMKLIQSPIETLGRYCASAAALLLAAGSKRYLLPHAKVMLHLPSGVSEGDTRDQAIQFKETLKYETRLVDALIECGAKKTHDEILADIDRNLWLEPQEAIEYGLADGIMTPEIWQSWIKEGE